MLVCVFIYIDSSRIELIIYPCTQVNKVVDNLKLDSNDEKVIDKCLSCYSTLYWFPPVGVYLAIIAVVAQFYH